MKVLGLDLATNTGWCIVDGGRYIKSGCKSFKKKRGDSNGIMFLKFRKWLVELCTKENVELITYEQAHFRGGYATEICVGLQTHAQGVAAEIDVPSYGIETKTLKLKATGKGGASKKIMIGAASKWTGKDITSDDEADAILLARYGYEDLNPIIE